MIHIGCILSVTLTISVFSNHTTGSSSHSHLKPSYLVAEDKKPVRDPGKEITEDPHGPDPHGTDASEEIHDKDLPANNPDKYYGDKKR